MKKHKKRILHGIKVNEYQERPIDKFIERFFIGSLFVMVLIALVLGFATKSKAATSGSLPYIPNKSPYFIDQSQVDIFIDAINQYDSSFDTSQPFIIFTEQVNSWYDWNHNVASPCYIIYFPEYTTTNNGYFLSSSFPSGKNFNNFDYNSDTFLLVTLNNFHCFYLVPRTIGTLYNGYSISEGNGSNGSQKGFFGGGSPVTVQNAYFDFTYLPEYPSYTSTSWFTSDGTQTKVFLTGSKIINGQVTDPDLVDTSDLPSSDPDINDYLPNTPEPTIDNTSLETLVESLFNWIKWQFQQIKGLFNFIADKFGYLIGKVLTGINNAINSLVDNLKSLFKPLLDSINGFLDNIKTLVQTIKEQIDYIVEPLSISVIYDNISQTSLMTNVNTIISSTTAFVNDFNSCTEPSTYKIPIHLELLPSNLFGTLTTQYIDLGVIDPVKSALRVLMWALTTYGLFYTVIDSIANYINGGQDE